MPKHNKSLEIRRENAGAFPASQLQRKADRLHRARINEMNDKGIIRIRGTLVKY